MDWAAIGSGLKVILLLLLPGVFYRWKWRGPRGEAAWKFFTESAAASLIIYAVVFGVGFLLQKAGLVAPEKVVAGLFFLFTGRFANIFPTLTGLETIFFIFMACFTGWAGGWTRKLWETRRDERNFILHPDSSLDVELIRLRVRKVAPLVTIRLREGREIKGRCRVYTFTEPRELTLEVSNDENSQEKKLVWLRLDERVERVEIEAEDTPQTRPKCVPLFKRPGRKECEQ